MVAARAGERHQKYISWNVTQGGAGAYVRGIDIPKEREIEREQVLLTSDNRSQKLATVGGCRC